jgi:two-component system nitrogen regulation response regulator GlnG
MEVGVGRSVTVPAAAPAAPGSREEAGTGTPGDVTALARSLFTWARAQRTLKVLPAVERELVICALAETRGNQVQTAKLLGITRATLRKRIEKFGILRELSIH